MLPLSATRAGNPRENNRRKQTSPIGDVFEAGGRPQRELMKHSGFPAGSGSPRTPCVDRPVVLARTPAIPRMGLSNGIDVLR
jgi:hypothetical protein